VIHKRFNEKIGFIVERKGDKIVQILELHFIDTLFLIPTEHLTLHTRLGEPLQDKRESVFKTLEDLKIGFVCVDEPSLPSLIPPIIQYTSNLGYIRFHGRNKKTWYGTDSTRRYDYLYSEKELNEWVPRIKEIAGHVDKLYVFFNNHAKAQAPNNAQMLINLLQ